MSHWAQIDENNFVIKVTVGDNNDPAGDEGYQWLIDNLGGNWIKTSYNHNIRKNFAGIGFQYNAELDAFIPPKPYPSWILNEDICQWEAPVLKPNDLENIYVWNEELQNWENKTS
jgi:hypothetical protein